MTEDEQPLTPTTLTDEEVRALMRGASIPTEDGWKDDPDYIEAATAYDQAKAAFTSLEALYREVLVGVGEFSRIEKKARYQAYEVARSNLEVKKRRRSETQTAAEQKNDKALDAYERPHIEVRKWELLDEARESVE